MWISSARPFSDFTNEIEEVIFEGDKALMRCGTSSRTHSTDALERLASLLFAIGVRLEPNGRLHIEAPFGLSDLLSLRLRPNPSRKITDFTRIAAGVADRWPELMVHCERNAG
jgi:hypothetical protein